MQTRGRARGGAGGGAAGPPQESPAPAAIPPPAGATSRSGAGRGMERSAQVGLGARAGARRGVGGVRGQARGPGPHSRGEEPGGKAGPGARKPSASELVRRHRRGRPLGAWACGARGVTQVSGRRPLARAPGAGETVGEKARQSGKYSWGRAGGELEESGAAACLPPWASLFECRWVAPALDASAQAVPKLRVSGVKSESLSPRAVRHGHVQVRARAQAA